MEALGFGEGDRLGGSVRVAATNARALAARGHEVLFLCTNRVDSRHKLFSGSHCAVRDGVTVHYLDTTTIPFWPGCFGPHYVQVPRSVETNFASAEVVHLCEFRSFLAQYAARLAARLHKPLIVQPQGTFAQHARRRLLKSAYDLFAGRRLVAKASRFIATTRVEAELFSKAGIGADRIDIVPNGIKAGPASALPKRGTFRAAYGISPATPVILSVGRVHEGKGFELMLHALERISGPARYVVVGPDDGFAAQLAELAKQRRLSDRFLMTGPLPRAEDVQAAIVDADIFVVPSRFEAFGQVILEACLAGRPLVLSTGCDAAAEFADRAALVVAPQPEPLAAACNRLLNDPALRERLGNAGRKIIDSDYRIEAIAAKLERIYESCRSKRPTVPTPLPA